MADRTPTVAINASLAETTHIQVRSDWNWANIYVRSFVFAKGKDNERTMVEVAINSDYGAYAFLWTHATGTWMEWLAGLDFDYAMKKLAEGRLYRPMPIADALAKLRKLVIERRREDSMTRADARELWNVTTEWWWEETQPADFYRKLDETTHLASRFELWDYSWEEVNPSHVSFWEHIWVPFAQHLKGLIAAEQAEKAA